MISPERPSTLRALLLDFGGTLAREVPGRGAIYAEAARDAGLEVTPEAMARHMGAAHDALPLVLEDGSFRYTRPWFERFIDHVFLEQLGLAEDRIGAVKEALFARFSDAATFQVFPGASRLIQEARALGLGVAIVSNWSDALVPLVDALGLGPFDAVLSSATERLEKPEPELFARALSRLGVRPEEALHVGDSHPNDVVGARESGIAAAFLDRRAPAARREPTHHVVRSLDDVRTLIRFAT